MNINNFIGVKDGAMSDHDCDDIVSHIVEMSSLGSRDSSNNSYGDTQFKNGKFGREDYQVFQPQQSDYKLKDIINCAFDGLDEYKHIISSVKSSGTLVSHVCKLQHTPVGGGFHEWHCEQGGGASSPRALVWMLYLNDVVDGGETEFLYQQMKCKPKKGTLVIWPAGITHPHRGNPPYSNDKYVATGWFEHPISEIYDVALRSFKVNSDA